MNITSLASLKRAISTPGVVIHVVEHWQPQLCSTSRVPSRIQGNGYFFFGFDIKGQRKELWSATPKASELRFNADGTVTYHPDTDRSWTLRFEVQS